MSINSNICIYLDILIWANKGFDELRLLNVMKDNKQLSY